ncbi:MAG: DUF1385 domain-containing protein [Clostridiales bacterium]|jgi:uncharacterized protein YqhQ|nr:DUF1385 domain-containing protein [Clostridiales bacterium]
MKEKDRRYRTTIGGQALIEGILMRGPEKQAIVVRTKDGLVVRQEEIKLSKEKYPFLGWPFIRGIVNFAGSMANGVKALMFSAQCLPEEEQEAEKSRLDRWIEKRFDDEKAEKLIVTIALIIGLSMSIVLFMLLPTLLAGLFDGLIKSRIVINLLEGAIRITIFLIYLWLATRMKDVHRVFEYHGGEHKSIHCYEKGLELTVENVRLQPRQHPRCGTSFLFVVIIISTLVFSLVRWSNPLMRMLFRLLLLPVVVAISYEINRFAGRHDNLFTRIITAPGLALQRLTVFEPDDGMIEVAIKGLELVIPEKEGSDKW